ncbi:MAG TPA: hypothetical protein VF791_01530 [Pyrinomonadaceae bacterium]
MRFTKAFQLIALALAFSMMQVYVMAGPIKAITDPRTTDTSSATAPTSEAAAATTMSSDSQLLTAKAASEKMPLPASSKTTLGRIFSKGNMAARIDSGNTFLKANTDAAGTFKASLRAVPLQSDDDSDSGGGGSRGAWIAVGVIAAVVVIAVIGLRHDRSHPNAATGL